MSRQITSEAISAFLTNTRFNKKNTSVTCNASGITIMQLHGNEIARKNWNGDGKIEVSNGGWNSNTTKERLNGIPGVSVYQKQRKWYLNGELWDGSWKTI